MSDPCKKVRQQLPAFVDGELGAEGEAFVNEHLKACPQCQKDLAFLKNTGQLIRAGFDGEIPEGLVDRAFAHAMSDQKAPGLMDLWSSLFPIAVPTAAAACVVALVLVGFTPQPAQPAKTPQGEVSSLDTQALLSSSLKVESQDIDAFLLNSYGLKSAAPSGGEGDEK
jgi:anti-sigma factor RsiW